MKMKPLTAFCALNMGQSPSSETYNEENVGLPFFQGNADFGEVHPKVRIWCSSPVKVAASGDILISVRAPIGAMNIANAPCCIGRGLAALSPNPDTCVQEYLYYALQSRIDSLIAQGTGSTFKAIGKKTLEDTQIPAYSLDEQQIISDTLSETDQLITKAKAQVSLLDQLVKSRFVEMFGNIQEMVPLSYYIRGLSAGKSLAGEDECVNKVLKTGATTYDYFDSTQLKNLPLDYIPQEEHRVKTGDVIISRMNTAELVGAAAYVWKAPDHTYLPDRLWKAEVRNTACPIFVWQLLIQKDTKESIRRIASGTSGSMKNISKPGLLGIRIIKVEIAAQNRFAAFVAEVDKSKFRIQKSLSTSRKLWTLARIDAIMNMDFSTQRSL